MNSSAGKVFEISAICADDFRPLIGGQFRFVAVGDHVEPSTVSLGEVLDTPAARNPRAMSGRPPFSLLFFGDQETPWVAGIFDIVFPNNDILRGVYINRVLNMSNTPAACFQVVFN